MEDTNEWGFSSDNKLFDPDKYTNKVEEELLKHLNKEGNEDERERVFNKMERYGWKRPEGTKLRIKSRSVKSLWDLLPVELQDLIIDYRNDLYKDKFNLLRGTSSTDGSRPRFLTNDGLEYELFSVIPAPSFNVPTKSIRVRWLYGGMMFERRIRVKQDNDIEITGILQVNSVEHSLRSDDIVVKKLT
jgi:hypothetical protein